MAESDILQRFLSYWWVVRKHEEDHPDKLGRMLEVISEVWGGPDDIDAFTRCYKTMGSQFTEEELHVVWAAARLKGK